MTNTLTGTRYIPKDSKEIAHPEGLGVCFKYPLSTGSFGLIAYKGKGNRAVFHYSYRDELALQKRVDSFFASLTAWEENKKARRAEPIAPGSVNDYCKRIREALNKRTGSPHWTCRHNTGTAYGWLTICAAPKFCTWHYVPRKDTEGKELRDAEGYPVYDAVNDPTRSYGYMSPSDCAELQRLLGLNKTVHSQGESVPASSDYHEEYLARAEGRTPTRYGVQYWD